MSNADDIYAKIREIQKLESKLNRIEKVVNKILDDRTGKFDWYKSSDGKAILKIKEYLNEASY